MVKDFIPRILVAKLGLDGHDVGAKLIARVLRDAGFEVIYTGIRQTPEAVARAAIDEDVDVVGLSILSGAHRVLVPRVVELVQESSDDIGVVVGGFIPEQDHQFLVERGVRAVFPVTASVDDMVATLWDLAREVRTAKMPSIQS